VVPFDAQTAGVTNEIAEQIGGADCKCPRRRYPAPPHPDGTGIVLSPQV